MRELWLSPPVAFLVILLVSLLLSQVSARFSFKSGKIPAGLEKSYTGGEDVPTNRVNPDYSQFFPFAFFFTILHVVALMITTVPTENTGAIVMALVYLSGAFSGLLMLFRGSDQL